MMPDIVWLPGALNSSRKQFLNHSLEISIQLFAIFFLQYGGFEEFQDSCIFLSLLNNLVLP